MSYETKLAVSISEIKKQVEQGDKNGALDSLNNLWEVTCRLKKNNEVITCSYMHGEEVTESARKENNDIMGSDKYPHEIILK